MTDILKQIFSVKSLFALLIANLTALLPFIYWTSVSWPLSDSLEMGTGLALSGTCLIGLPTLYNLARKGETDCRAYFAESNCWLLGWALFLAVCALFLKSTMALLFALMLPLMFTLFFIPVNLCCLTYWYIAVRDERNELAFAAVLVLFFLWNFECMQIAALVLD